MDTFINYTSPELMRVFCYDKDGYDLKGVNKDGYCRNGEKWEDIDEQIYPPKKVIRRTLSPANDAVDLKSRCTLKEFMAILNNAIYLTSTC